MIQYFNVKRTCLNYKKKFVEKVQILNDVGLKEIKIANN